MQDQWIILGDKKKKTTQNNNNKPNKDEVQIRVKVAH